MFNAPQVDPSTSISVHEKIQIASWRWRCFNSSKVRRAFTPLARIYWRRRTASGKGVPSNLDLILRTSSSDPRCFMLWNRKISHSIIHPEKSNIWLLNFKFSSFMTHHCHEQSFQELQVKLAANSIPHSSYSIANAKFIRKNRRAREEDNVIAKLST